MEKQPLVCDKEVQIVLKALDMFFNRTNKSSEYFQNPLPYLCTCTITVDAKRKDLVEERKSERQMKIETSRKFLNCTIIAYSFLRNGYNYCLANVFRKMEIAYNNGDAHVAG